MSCEECDKIQELNKEDKECAYIRIGNGNVLIGACDKHFNEMRKELLNTEEEIVVVRVSLAKFSEEAKE